MNTFLGSCRKYSKLDLNEEHLVKSKIFYTTGYMWDTDSQKQAAIHAFKIAKKNNILIVFNLADPLVVKRNCSEFQELISAYVDIVISNEEEAEALTGKEDSIRFFKKSAIITKGSEGSLVSEGNHYHKIDAFLVNAVDSTGAGDMYAAGVLYGLSRNLSIVDAARIGSLYASWIVTQVGVRIL